MAYDKKIAIGVFASLQASDTTTIITAGDYVPISGTFSNSPLEKFELTETPSIKYAGTKTMQFEIDWHATVSSDKATSTVKCGIMLNDSLVADSGMSSLLKIANEPQAMSGTVVVQLSENDEIQLVTTSDGDGDVLTFLNYTTTIRPFFNI